MAINPEMMSSVHHFFSESDVGATARGSETLLTSFILLILLKPSHLSLLPAFA
ncbi:hypothetical protein [Moraxella lacunata]|uniref:hypothetical protein n=1 Tax=Moraxella lacunata TaxID=477 RepID=UPI003EDF8C4C